VGQPLNDDIRDNIPRTISGKMKNQCCRSYTVNWNGRWINDVICASNIETCEVTIKIIRSSIYKLCLKKSIAQAALALTKPKLNHQSK